MHSKEKNRYFIQTFGCQMNVNDSEKVAGLLESRGFRAVASPAEADFVFLNTCAVREKATTKFKQSLVRLGRMKKGRPELQIGVGGCVAQLEGESLLAGSPQIDVLVGTHNIRRIPELVERVRGDGAHARRPRSGRRRLRRARHGHGPRQPGARVRDGDGGLQPRLQLLRRAPHARSRGEPARRPDRRGGRGRRRAGLHRGHAPRADRQRLPLGRPRLRRSARARGPCPRLEAAALHDLAPEPRRPSLSRGRSAISSTCARTSTCRSSRARTGCSARCAAATRVRSTWRRSRCSASTSPGSRSRAT